LNPRLAALQPYPFERLRALHAGIVPTTLPPISLSIGEPQHAPPPFVVEALRAGLAALGTYPTVVGSPALRAAAAGWLARRYALPDGAVDPATMVLPVAGTREALFSFAQAVIDTAGGQKPLVVMPNPGYQIYEGAALLAGAEPYYLDCRADNGWRPDLAAVPAAVWERCQLLYLCSPGNPTGAVHPAAELQLAIELAHRHDFVVAADECYADIYTEETAPPPGCLAAAHGLGLDRFERVVVFHSLSKRSSVPGLRSGFVAGDPALMERYRLYRTYHGCALPGYVQSASTLAWNDEAHAADNRRLYAAKFAAVAARLEQALPVTVPAGAFYLWADVGTDDAAFARELYRRQNVIVLPGSFLARAHEGANPGAGRVRISLVAPLAECVEAADRIIAFLGDPRR
jgi:N-succinyldiaminopimelate aminotransferase